jgi:hypothetical protein
LADLASIGFSFFSSKNVTIVFCRQKCKTVSFIPHYNTSQSNTFLSCQTTPLNAQFSPPINITTVHYNDTTRSYSSAVTFNVVFILQHKNMKSIVWILAVQLLARASSQGELPAPEDKPNEAKLMSRISVGNAPLEQRNYQVAPAPYNLAEQSEPYNIAFDYHNYDQMTRFLRATTSKYPSLTALYSIGKSVQGL